MNKIVSFTNGMTMCQRKTNLKDEGCLLAQRFQSTIFDSRFWAMMRQDIMAQEEETVHTIEGRGQSVKQERGTSFRLQLHSPSDLLVPAQPCHQRLRISLTKHYPCSVRDPNHGTSYSNHNQG